MTMTATKEQPAASAAGYTLTGTLLEACSCNVLCPCWIGENPDPGTCDAFTAYHFDRGAIRGVDVSGLSYVEVHHAPGNVLDGNWRAVWFISAQASDEQFDAIRDAFSGKLGGPLADLANLFGDVMEVRRAPIVHEVVGGKGTLRIADLVSGEMEPYRAPDGDAITTLRDSIFSTVPGSPAYVAKAQHNIVKLPEYGLEWSFEGRNAIQSDWHLEHPGGAA
jgi:hypothetical protein